MRRLAVIICSLLITIAAYAQDASVLLPYVAAGGSVSSFSPADLSPVSWWKFDGNVTDSMGVNNGTATAISYTTGLNGQAAVFNGSAKVACGTGASLNLTNAITVCAWVNVTAFSGNCGFFCKDAADGFYSWLPLSSVNMEWKTTGTPGDSLLGAHGMTTSAWHHVAMTYDRTGGANNKRVYRDGSIILQETDTGYMTSRPSGNFTIGTIFGGAVGFVGKMDDFMVFGRALTTAEILQVYNWRQ